MKKPKSIFSGFEAYEIKHTASIEGGYGTSGSGGGIPCGTTNVLRFTAATTTVDTNADSNYPDGTYGDHNPDC
jgi:hypothetical protein